MYAIQSISIIKSLIKCLKIHFSMFLGFLVLLMSITRNAVQSSKVSPLKDNSLNFHRSSPCPCNDPQIFFIISLFSFTEAMSSNLYQTDVSHEQTKSSITQVIALMSPEAFLNLPVRSERGFFTFAILEWDFIIIQCWHEQVFLYHRFCKPIIILKVYFILI